MWSTNYNAHFFNINVVLFICTIHMLSIIHMWSTIHMHQVSSIYMLCSAIVPIHMFNVYNVHFTCCVVQCTCCTIHMCSTKYMLSTAYMWCSTIHMFKIGNRLRYTCGVVQSTCLQNTCGVVQSTCCLPFSCCVVQSILVHNMHVVKCMLCGTIHMLSTINRHI